MKMEVTEIENAMKCGLDVPRSGLGTYSVEDQIFATLFTEKGLSMDEIFKRLGVNYRDIISNINRMINHGYIVERSRYNDKYYYLTSSGMYELEFRFNERYFMELHAGLEARGYNRFHVEKFLKNRFYRFYLEGKWEVDRLEDQYLDWCESNDISSKSENVLRLKTR